MPTVIAVNSLAIRKYEPDAVVAIVQGRLVGCEITAAGLSAQPKAARQPAHDIAAAAGSLNKVGTTGQCAAALSSAQTR